MLRSTRYTCKFLWFMLFVVGCCRFLRRMGKKKALAHHTSTYFHTRRVLPEYPGEGTREKTKKQRHTPTTWSLARTQGEKTRGVCTKRRSPESVTSRGPGRVGSGRPNHEIEKPPDPPRPDPRSFKHLLTRTHSTREVLETT